MSMKKEIQQLVRHLQACGKIKNLILISLLSVLSTQLLYSQTGDKELPKEKQTTPALYVTSREAYEMWKADPDRVKIIDVRTPEEFIYVGHGAMAWNIPLR